MSNKNLGSSLDEFLAEEGLLEEVEAVALKRVITFQLEEYMRQLHDGKHQAVMMVGKVARLFSSDGFGFIESEDGTEFYFNANHVAHPDFHKLSVGMPVHFIKEMGHNGPQAHRVKLVEKQAE